MPILGHGIDLIDVKRIHDLRDRQGARFLDRVFTNAEQAYAASSPKRQDERLAARFAAKEAVLKALGTGWSDGIAWTEIEVIHDSANAPSLNLTGRVQDLASERGIDHWVVSLTHTDTLASASVIAQGPA